MINALGHKYFRSMGISFSLLISILLLISACGSNRGIVSADEAQDFRDLREVVSSREFEIENQWAMPMGGNMVNLIGNPNKIEFKGDSVQVHLPYFGIRYSGGGYGNEGGIKFNGTPEDLSVEEDKEEGKIVVKFEGKHKNENFNFFITLFSNGTANTSVNTSQRSTISYRGDIKPISAGPEENE